MKSGLKTLHDIDTAIVKARSAVTEASLLPKRSAEALVELRRQQSLAYDKIAEERLGLISKGEGGELGYVDRQAGKYLKAHDKELAAMGSKLDKAVARIEKLESERRNLETKVNKAIDAYDKAAAKAEKEILKDPAYIAALDRVEQAENTVIRASEKLEVARQDELEKGAPYKNDPLFSYLHKRGYGTKKAKGWFLTKMLDSWVASIIKYRRAAENYQRLQAIPTRLGNHVKALEDKVLKARAALEKLEAEILEAKGVTALHKASIKAQSGLEKTDEKIAGAEREYSEIRAAHQSLLAGDTGSFREAINVVSEAMTRIKFNELRRLASQTTGRDDDRAIEEILDLARVSDELEDEQKEAKTLIRKYERTLKELEDIRRRFKSRRYDAPSSVFDGNLVGALLLRVLAGALDGDSLWRQIERAQRTTRRYSDSDFGGVDWTEGLRLPRTSRTHRSPRSRTSIPRMPRTSLPKVKLPRSSGRSSGRSGGFRTGGGF
ncbi:MAG: hypothetical protein HKN36_13745 [Hellea sp.]|nr:hypothetical protein [Hellea sp.]